MAEASSIGPGSTAHCASHNMRAKHGPASGAVAAVGVVVMGEAGASSPSKATWRVRPQTKARPSARRSVLTSVAASRAAATRRLNAAHSAVSIAAGLGAQTSGTKGGGGEGVGVAGEASWARTGGTSCSGLETGAGGRRTVRTRGQRKRGYKPPKPHQEWREVAEEGRSVGPTVQKRYERCWRAGGR